MEIFLCFARSSSEDSFLSVITKKLSLIDNLLSQYSHRKSKIVSTSDGLPDFEIKRKVTLYAEITILYMVFFHTDLLTSFALYFGFCHSLPMLMLEFKEFKTDSFMRFYLKTLPFTILSIIFGFLLYQFNNDLLTSDNLILFVFIIISSLTLPHVFIMKDFVKDK